MSFSRHRTMVVTPPGTGAIAVIRVIGSDPMSILRDSFVHPQGRKPKPDGKLVYGRLMDGSEMLDDVLLSVEPFGEQEQALEISCHGGVRILQCILGLLERGGAVVVEADRAAGLSCWPCQNKIEDEAIEALISAKTVRAARYAASLRKELPRELQRLVLQYQSQPDQVRHSVEKFLEGYGAAKALLGGITVALVGPPNTGKSTLFNTLLGREAVVTSPVAGTTRDWVMESVDFQGVLVNLVDTAGRRETECQLERVAIEAGDSVLQKSTAVFFVFDGSIPLTQNAMSMLERPSRRTWVVANKSDIGFCWKQNDLEGIMQACGSYPIQVSASVGTGCELLRGAIVESFGLGDLQGPPLAFFTDRQTSLAKKVSDSSADLMQIARDLLGDKAGGQHGQSPIIGSEEKGQGRPTWQR